MQEYTCCFFGHRAINETEELKSKLTETIERLIKEEKVNTFLFGSKSRFDSLCLETLTKIKEKYPHVKRVYVRAEYPVISDEYTAYLLNFYDATYYPEQLLGSGRAAYVKRNCEMIEQSRFCIVYYSEAIASATPKSGTGTALDYARKKGREVIFLC